MTSSDHGHAVYLEFHDSDGAGRVAQLLVIGYTAIEDTVVNYRVLSRTISPQNPQLQWRPDVSKVTPDDVTTGLRPSTLSRTVPNELAPARAEKDFAVVSGIIDALTSLRWDFYMEPFVVQVSQLDIADLAANQTPKKLLDRVRRVRQSKGWSELPSAAPKGGKR